MKGKIKDFDELKDRSQKIVLILNDDFKKKYAKLKDCDVEIKIEKFVDSRTKRANRYAWHLISQIADVLHSSEHETYIELLRQFGQREPDKFSIVEESVDTMFRILDDHCLVVAKSDLNGKTFAHLVALIGSSKYDSKQFHIFMGGVVDKAKELGIDTRTPDEISVMCEEWVPD